jgi:hypothetical protein
MIFLNVLNLDSCGVVGDLHFGSDMVYHLGYLYVVCCMCDDSDDYSRFQE